MHDKGNMMGPREPWEYSLRPTSNSQQCSWLHRSRKRILASDPFIVLFFLLVIFLASHLFLIAGDYRGNSISSTKLGAWGDFIGGYVGTVILIGSTWALVLQLIQQTDSSLRSSFESTFFEMLRQHREHVDELELEAKVGRRVFVSFIREFRVALELVRDLSNSELETNFQTVRLAYIAFYFGIGPNSTRLLRNEIQINQLCSMPLASKLIEQMEHAQDTHIRSANDEAEEPHIWTAEEPLADRSSRRPLKHRPFGGHQSRLGHYFRHLYQLITYINDSAPGGEQMRYVDILRAQLTNHELALILLNALSPLGKDWRTKEYITKYQLIKDLPRQFFEPQDEINVEEFFPEMQFEHEEIL